MYGDDNGSEGPRGTFEIYRAEADSLYKQGEYRKAIDSYTLALELTPGEKNCLVARSKCHLQLGDMISALNDAEASLEEDKNYHKGIYQKAQALYYQGDFEMALVFYHRGHKLRPELQEFRLGIQKAQEAIDNSVGSPDTVKLTTEGDLSYFDQLLDDKKIKRKAMTYGRPAAQQYNKTTTQRVAVGSEKTIKQLLGELYGDRQYLEKLLKETDPKSEMGKTISTLVNEGLSYLDTRSDFWRQQKPMYARRHDRLMQRRKRESSSHKISPNDYIIKELERIDQAQVEGRYQEALKRSQKCLSTVQGFTEDDVPNKVEVIANIHSCIGNAHLEMGAYEKALDSHQTDLNLGETNDMMEAVSRGLDNIGRVHARKGAFAQAIEVWERKVPMSKSPLESTWLYHEIGRCYLELDKYAEAKSNGEQSETAALEAEDQMWQLQALVLTAQAEVKLSELTAAVATFEKASELAKAQGDKSAETAIKKAIDEINSKIVDEGTTAPETTGETEAKDGNENDNRTTEKTEDKVEDKQPDSKESETKEEEKSADKVTPKVSPKVTPRDNKDTTGEKVEDKQETVAESNGDTAQDNTDKKDEDARSDI
ncbi:outer dynein arm-docking complex subunit 4-like isoform X2 [Mercenaria mercenaria]|uniref:outer dynein arm-docking complex subunit 4-like isoform X2 n=1 Tax=Mercenaria mercenaria TaxID=6596 RepID=UPI001E1D6F88|nr:outer dynein arm-docking complex subunit 4-like isoform X2 [Mercenaria mercenaria]